MDVSVVIVNWNTCDILRDCLASIYENTRNLEFEVIVVDNASTDGSVDMVTSVFPQVVFVKNSKNRGFAAANNQALGIAKGRYVLLLNSDTVVLGNAIKKTIDFADSHPKAGIVGCRVLNPDKSLQPTCFMFPSILNMLLSATYLYKLFPKSRFFGRERMTWWDRNNVMDVDVVTGCFMLVRKEVIGQIGLLDERFFMYFEETDWCYRFKQAGWKVMFTPHAEIIHLARASTNQIKPKMVAQWRKSMLFFFRKHKSPLIYSFAWTLIAFFYLTRLPYWVGKAVISKNANNMHL